MIEDADISLDGDLLEEVLHEIYEEQPDAEKGEFNRKYARATKKKLTEATNKGFNQSSDKKIRKRKTFLEKYDMSLEIFAAFKSHKYSEMMVSKLFDKKGNLLSFEQWKKATKSIQSHFNETWLRTEYNTAVKRAQMAADWQKFIDESEIFPRLKWMPTTSADPREEHKKFWEIGLTLPVNDPFWRRHHPGDRWNCKCSLEQTDEKSTPRKDRPTETDAPRPADGLEENPGVSKSFVSPKHPYYPDPKTCPWLKMAKKGVKNGLLGRFFNADETCDNKCHECKLVRIFADKNKNEKFFKEIENDPNFINKEMNEKGGVRGESIHHKKSPNKERFFKNENNGNGWKGTELELKCQDNLFKNGHSCILMPEGLPDGKGGELTALDSKIDGIRMDIKSVTNNNKSYINQVTSKIDQLNKWNDQNPNDKSDYLCIYIHDKNLFSREKIKKTIENVEQMKYKGKNFPMKHIFVVVNGIEEIIKFDI